VTAGLGSAFDYTHYNPSNQSVFGSQAKGKYTGLKSYVFLKFNSLNLIFFPTKGIKLNTEFAWVYNQRPKLALYQNGLPVSTAGLNFDNYTRLAFDGSAYTKLGSRFTFLTNLQAGINFTDKPNVLNNFIIGGINGDFRNQVKFAGFQEGTVNASSVVALQMGLRFNLFNNAYVTGRVNGLVKDFATTAASTSKKNFLSGYALTFSYKTPIGPMELSAMYCDQSRKVQSYVLFGIPF
jgi:NTE family protein